MKLPEVVIVGRVNTGKSTLFNRIIKKPLAIVGDKPGLTRDSIRKEVEWNDKKFIIIDSGGLYPPEEDAIWEKVKEKIEETVKEADLVVFLVDLKSGPVPQDKDIAEWLRKLNKKVILVGNKGDVKTPLTYDFYELGFGEPLVVSAEQNCGIGELLDRITENLPQTRKKKDKDKIRCAIIGKPNVGKSSLLNAILGKDYAVVSDIPGTTRDSLDIVTSRFIFIDTAGIKKKFKDEIEYFAHLRSKRSISYSEVCIVVIDASAPLTHIDKRIIQIVEEEGKGIVIAFNKIDLLSREERKSIVYLFEREMPSAYYIPKVLISAKTGERIPFLKELVFKVRQETKKRIGDKRTEEFIMREISRYIPSFEIIRFFQSRAEPPTFVMITKGKPRLDYLKYLEKRIRQEFGFIGAPIKFDIKIRK